MVSESIKGLKDKTNLQKLGVGVVAAVISNSIEWGMNKEENDLYKEFIDKINDTRGESKGGINIKAVGQ